MAMSVYCLCFRLLKLPQFSLLANMPFATLIQGRKDIINIMVILCVFTTANSLAAYIVFCPTSPSFTNLNQSIFTLLKIYLGDFSPVQEMYFAAPGFTTFYLLLMMSLYTIFLTNMFLGIIVGHFNTEWNLVKDLTSAEDQKFNVAAVVWRIVYKYFKEREKEQLAKDRANESLLGDYSEKRKKVCPCTWSSFNPSGMLERVVVYFMMRACCKKKAETKYTDSSNFLSGKSSNALLASSDM